MLKLSELFGQRLVLIFFYKTICILVLHRRPVEDLLRSLHLDLFKMVSFPFQLSLPVEILLLSLHKRLLSQCLGQLSLFIL